MVVAVLALLKQFFRRACAVDQLGVTASIGQGFAVAKQHALNAGVMGLILVGLKLVWGIAMIPVVVALVVMAGGSGTVGSMFLTPLLDEALAAHESDDRAHNVDRLEDRLGALERKIDAQSEDLADVKGSVSTAVRLLESR